LGGKLFHLTKEINEIRMKDDTEFMRTEIKRLVEERMKKL